MLNGLLFAFSVICFYLAFSVFYCTSLIYFYIVEHCCPIDLLIDTFRQYS